MSLRSYACGCNFESKERFLLRAIGRTPVMANTVSAAAMPCAVELLCVLAQHLLDRFDLGETEALKRAGTRAAFGGTRPLRREGVKRVCIPVAQPKASNARASRKKRWFRNGQKMARRIRGAHQRGQAATRPRPLPLRALRPDHPSPPRQCLPQILADRTASSRNQRGRFNSVNGRT
jgi:hypothetical protein